MCLIVLNLQCSGEIKNYLDKHLGEIKEKVGAEKLEVSELEAAKKHEHKSDFKIKGKFFVASFDKV